MRAVIPHPYGGHVLMTGFPGLETAVDGSGYFDPASCAATLGGLKAAGTAELVVLVERDELDRAGFDLLERTAAEVGLTLAFHEIEDFNVPSDDMFAWWQTGQAARAQVLRGGGALAFSCQHGAGRSGLMASLCLMDAGLSAPEAIAAVRVHFSEAVESEAQETWLHQRTPIDQSP